MSKTAESSHSRAPSPALQFLERYPEAAGLLNRGFGAVERVSGEGGFAHVAPLMIRQIIPKPK